MGKVQFIAVYPRGARSFFRNYSVSGEAEFRLFRRDVVGPAPSLRHNFLVAGLYRQFRGLRSTHV